MKKSSVVLCAVCAALLAGSNRCQAVLVADLKGDYRPANTLGQTSNDMGLTGTLAGSWRYYQDTDSSPTNGHNGLLTWQMDSDYVNSKTGYAGTNGDFGLRFPIISADRLLDGPTPGPPAGSVMGHPSSSQFLAIEYKFGPVGQVDNLSIDYCFERPNGGGSFQRVVVSIVKGNGVALFAPTNVGVGGVGIASGTLSGLGTLAAGESIWLMLGSYSGFSDGDQTWLQMTLNGDPVGVPEASGLFLLALTVGSLIVADRRRRRRQSISTIIA